MNATNFDVFVISIAEEAPHAVVLDWYRRLELMIRDYHTFRRLTYRKSRKAESVIASDVFIGADVANAIARLRLFRNRIAHEALPVMPAEAVAFARESFDLIGRLWGTQDRHAS